MTTNTKQYGPKSYETLDPQNIAKKLISEEPNYYRPLFAHKNECPPQVNKKLRELISKYQPTDVEFIEGSIVKHIEYHLGRTAYNTDKNVYFQAAAYSIRDRLLEIGNDARCYLIDKNTKRVNYFSMEYLPGRSLKNALLNLNLEENYRKALEELGYQLEDIYEEELDPGLGNGGLGRLASCFLDSMATQSIPVWGYGIRYNYGIFKQKIVNGGQCEVPDYWLIEGYPWEIRRGDVGYRVRFYGKVSKKKDENGREKVVWEGGEEIHALAYDQLVSGYHTFNAVALRLWRAKPSKEFDFSSFNHGDYYKALLDKQKAEFISGVLYPNDSTEGGKELRVKQQYFFVSASLQDILRRFRFSNEENWDLLPEKVAIQLNDTHPTLAIVELLRLLIDEYSVEWDKAWRLVRKIFAYTNHTVMPEALEMWTEELIRELLPRHLELIQIINWDFLEEVKKKFPGDGEKLKKLSIFKEEWGSSTKIRMANLAVIGSHKVNGVAEIHTEILKKTIFKEFHEMYPEKFLNITNGVTHRRWIACANPDLGNFYTEELRSDEWFLDMEKIKGLLHRIQDPKFRERWNEIKQKNKKKLRDWVKQKTEIELDEDSMFDVMIKRIHEYKRQFMNALYVIHRYLRLKEASEEERAKFVKRSVLIGGKAAPGYENAKAIIQLIVSIAKVINEDEETKEYLKLVFLPNYNVTNAEVIIPGADINQNISTVGTEASGTSNMKFCMNGAILLATMDGANVEIAREIGEENMIAFGARLDNVDEIREKVMRKNGGNESKEFKKVAEAVEKGMFGKTESLSRLMGSLQGNNDRYLVMYDFESYLEAQEKMDKWYKDREGWTKKSIITALKCSKFSSDRSVREYAKNIWGVEPVVVPSPESTGKSICKDFCRFPANTEDAEESEK